ncbi:MAG: type III-B CRISPR module RAMP protein Cmr1 [Candidatus Lokiarchaeota archaeon]|nr:type III-B CRISPR module RAMP protein Cmr1 [Candidatus Lokiarchaeota archaeon]
MKELKFKIITPMFLGDARGASTELRPPSVKGMLRFWWRAIKACDEKDLRKEEARIFGSSEEEIGRSKFRIIIKDKIVEHDTKDYKLLPHHEGGRNCPYCKNKGDGFCHKGRTFSAIVPETSFSVLTDADEKIQQLFHISSILGGLGKRSRRGFGSFQKVDFEQNFRNVEEVLKVIKNLLNGINNQYNLNGKISLMNTLKLNYPYIKEIEIGNSYLNSNDLLKKIGITSHEMAKKYSKGDSLGFAQRKNRLASPIYVSTIKLDNQYFPIITTLKTAFKNDWKKVNTKQQNEFKNIILKNEAIDE